MSNYQQLCWIHITITAIIVCSVTGSNTNESYDHPPVIVGFHDSQDIYLNTQNVLECSANGSQPMKYTWFLNGEMITNTSVFVVNSNGTLVIKSTTNKTDKTYTGTYHCIASNDIGKARSGDRHAHIAELVKYPGLSQPEYPVLNYPFVLNCSKDLVKFSRPWPPTFEWTYENSTLFIFEMYTFKVDDGGALVFSNYRDTDPKVVKCAAKNEIAREKHTLVYRLNYSREVQGHQNYNSTDQTVLEGKHVSLYCVFYNSSGGSMKWTKNGEDIPGENSPTFEIKNAASSDAGSYQCSKGNSSHVIQVIVDAKAKIDEFGNTTNNRVRVGDTAKFSCFFSGRPEPNITWLIDGVSIATKFSNPARYYNESTDVSGSPYRSYLVLFNVSYNASVICKASNKYGSQLSGSYVMASDVPETLEQLTTEVTTGTTDDSEYSATSTQNQQELRYDAVNDVRPGERTEVVENLILAVALSVSVSIIVTFVMVLVICFVLRRRNDLNTTTTTEATRTDVEVQDHRQPPSFVQSRQEPQHEHGHELEEILVTSPQYEHGHEDEETPLTSLQNSDS